MHLQQTDPWLAYQLGYSYFQREWKREDGVFQNVKKRPIAAAVNSCAMCHNLPFRSPGSGGNVAEPVGFGRNAPHLFGVGLIEMIGLQIRQQILNQFDKNTNGYIDTPSEARGDVIISANSSTRVDFGAWEDYNGDGWPDLNDVLVLRLVDEQGHLQPFRSDGTPSQPDDPGIGGYDLFVGIFSSSVGDHQFGTIRPFAIGVMHTVMGLDVVDPTTNNDSGQAGDVEAGDGWALVSNAGALQQYFPASLAAKSPEMIRRYSGDYISEGELDLLEWFLLNHPPPAVTQGTDRTKRGRALMDEFGCTTCHVSDWKIQGADPENGLSGDRRFFNLAIHSTENGRQLRGILEPLSTHDTTGTGLRVKYPRRDSFTVRNIFTDFIHHDLGERFYEYTYKEEQLYVTRRFRTPPLWGVGSTPPYGHDGRSPTLDDVIRRHAGEAYRAANAYIQATPDDRRALISFLKMLVLYQPDLLPTDVNGDGRISKNYVRGEQSMGAERFNPELLLRVPPDYRGWVTGSDGASYFSYELLNVQEAYGLTLDAMQDADRDGVPDTRPSEKPP